MPDRTPGPEDAVVVTRSEERLAVGTERVPIGRVRVAKRIVEETRQIPVTLRREELVVEHLPAGAGGVAEPAGELVLTLSEEVPVVTTSVRPVERVRIRVDRVTGEQVVGAELARERVEVTGDAVPGAGDGLA